FTGDVVPGTLIERRERVVVELGEEERWSAFWMRITTYEISFQPAGARDPLRMTIRTDTQTLDRLPAPGPIEIRYLRWLGLLTYARWTGEPSWAFARALWQQLSPFQMVVDVGVAFLLFAWMIQSWNRHSRPRGRPASRDIR